jgi:hypothetical protein
MMHRDRLFTAGARELRRCAISGKAAASRCHMSARASSITHVATAIAILTAMMLLRITHAPATIQYQVKMASKRYLVAPDFAKP